MGNMENPEDFQEYYYGDEDQEDYSGFDEPLPFLEQIDPEIEDGPFKEMFEDMQRHNNQLREFIGKSVLRGEMTTTEADRLWSEDSVTLDGVITESKDFETGLEYKAKRIKQQKESGELSEFQAEIALDKLDEMKFQYERKLRFQSVGLSMDKIVDTADDAGHILEDTYDPDSRQLRKELLKNLKCIPKEDREAMIDNLLENGEIDEGQYAYLCAEFL